GPGQVAITWARSSSASGNNQGCSCSSDAATTTSPLCQGRSLSSRIRAMACSLAGSQPSPHTASVGEAGTPPARIQAPACSKESLLIIASEKGKCEPYCKAQTGTRGE